MNSNNNNNNTLLVIRCLAALHKHNNKSIQSFSSLPLSLLQSLEPALLIVVTTLHYTAQTDTTQTHLHSCRTCRTWCPHPRPSDSRCSHCRCAGRRCTESGRTRRQWDRRSGRRRSPSRDSLKELERKKKKSVNPKVNAEVGYSCCCCC